MSDIIHIDGTAINTTNRTLFCESFENELNFTIDLLNNAKATGDSDLALSGISSFKVRGVFFPSTFMFYLAKTNNRLPTPGIISSLFPGFSEIYESLKSNWESIRKYNYVQNFVSRVLINLGLCTSCTNLLDITPSAFSAIMNMWKEPDGYWNSKIILTDVQISSIINIGRAFSRCNNDTRYTHPTKQPRSCNSHRFGPDYVFCHPETYNEQWIAIFNEWLHGQFLKNTNGPKCAIIFLLDWLKLYPEDVAKDPRIFFLFYSIF